MTRLMALSPEAERRLEQALDECQRLDGERPTIYTMMLDLPQVEDLAAGCVPRTVIAMARMLLETDDQIRRNAQKPVRKRNDEDKTLTRVDKSRRTRASEYCRG